MHPAYSVIFFTTASGAGYGLLAMLGLLSASSILPTDRWFAIIAFALSLGAVTFGLLSSTFHLGHPERAIKAYSQWRTSWLSREGVLATATYVPAAIFAIGWIFYGETDGIFRALGLATTALCGFTVYATGMIYATLAPIHAWCNRWVVPNYLALSLLTGTLWLNALVVLFGRPGPDISMVLVLALFVSFYLKRKYWRFIDTSSGPSTPESATGLGRLGKVRLLDPPGTQTTFVTTEMGFRVARKHVAKLRRYTFIFLFAIPLICSLAAMGETAWLAIPAGLLAALSASLGVVIERWLFFAEARHAVTLYHGAEAA